MTHTANTYAPHPHIGGRTKDSPGSLPVGEDGKSALLIRGLVQQGPSLGEITPEEILLPSEEERVKAPVALSRGADYVRVWNRADEEVLATLISDTPFTGADLSPDGILLVATKRGVKALRIRTPTTATAS